MRILLVEDDERIIRFMKRGLEAEDYEVDVASDGQSGTDMAKNSPYHLVILDVYLPEKSGLEICKSLREQAINVPILIMTAKDSPEVEHQSILAGANGYLAKPFSFEVLLTKIEKLREAAPNDFPTRSAL